MLPVPLATNPIDVLVFVQLIVAPEDALNVIAPVALPPQTTTSLEGIVSVGGFGSLSVIGPNVFDEHPFNVTVIFSYTPAVRLLITILPPVVDVRDAGVTATPFFEYAKVYVVLAASPFNVMLPVDDPQVDGFDEVAVMDGLGLIVTVALADEKQFDDVTVPVTW